METKADDTSCAPRGDSRPRGGKKRAVFIGTLLAAALGGAYYLYAAKGSQSTDDAAVKGDQVVVSAQLMAQIKELAVDEHARVSRGQVLVRLDDDSLKAQERQAIANEEYATENVQLAKAKFDQAQADLQRAAVQLKSKVIPQEQYDHLNSAYSVALAQMRIAEAQVKQTEAQLAVVRASLSHTVIASPIDGVVAKKWTTAGNIVQPAQSIYALYDLSSLWIEAYFKETQVGSIAIGDSAEVRVDAFPGRHFAGRVESIGEAAATEFSLMPPDNASGNFTKVTQRIPVKIALARRDAPSETEGWSLVPGISVEVTVRTGRR